jgi:hypothetical protein
VVPRFPVHRGHRPLRVPIYRRRDQTGVESTHNTSTRDPLGWSDQYHSLQNDADQSRSTQRLLARAISGYSEGIVTAQTVATLGGISANEVADKLTEAGVIPREHPSVDVKVGELAARTPASKAKEVL